MNLIAAQPYVKVQREVSSLEQKRVEHRRVIYLYEEKVVTQHREFPLSQVLDMTYRKIGGEGGLLYLHTSRGVYSYTVQSTPVPFIEAFKNRDKSREDKG